MKVPWLVIIILVMILLFVVFASFSGNEVIQPIRYNHNIHVEDAGLDCIECHQYYETSEVAGLPALDDCALCHSDLLGENPEEEKLVTLIQKELPLYWKRIFQLPRHVFFSHRRHIILAQLECDACHGDMQALTVPPQYSANKITMDFCMDCHETQEVSNDCVDCHR